MLMLTFTLTLLLMLTLAWHERDARRKGKDRTSSDRTPGGWCVVEECRVVISQPALKYRPAYSQRTATKPFELLIPNETERPRVCWEHTPGVSPVALPPATAIHHSTITKKISDKKKLHKK